MPRRKRRQIEFEPTPEREAKAEAERDKKEQQINERLAHSLAMLAKAMTRVKRAATLQRKWQRRVKQNENALRRLKS